jgi:NADH-quinone oxidoreductase subunit H
MEPQLITSIFFMVFVLSTIMGSSALLIWVERRLLGAWQDRYGPNRAGPGGILQAIADLLKILTKEDWIPPFADKPVFIAAPGIIIVTVLLSFAVVPIAPGIGIVDLNIGLLFFLASEPEDLDLGPIDEKAAGKLMQCVHASLAKPTNATAQSDEHHG